MMAETYGGGGDIRQLYGVILRDKAKTADKDTLMAYRIVVSDLMHGASDDAAKELQGALAELEAAIQAHW
jgi:hypothetical protein